MTAMDWIQAIDTAALVVIIGAVVAVVWGKASTDTETACCLSVGLLLLAAFAVVAIIATGVYWLVRLIF